MNPIDAFIIGRQAALASTPVYADVSISDVIDKLDNWVLVGGGLWAIFGAITLGSALKDHNGPGIQNGVWQLVGAGLIIASAALFKSISIPS